MKISIISTGGTIACKKDDNIHLDSPFKVVDYADENLTRDVDFSFSSPLPFYPKIWILHFGKS